MTTSSTPVFNNICGVPSYGDESDFLRIRVNNGGAAYGAGNTFTDSVSTVCNDGDKFDIKSYLHNDAEPQYNSGAGTGIAHNVAMANSSPLGTTSSSFNFSSRITANNAASVFDTAKLNCSGGPVTLTLVPNSALLEREFTNGGVTPLADSAANGSIPISSDPAVYGDVPGCWNYRVQVAYTVIVHKAPQQQASGTCDMLSIAAAPNRTVNITALNSTTNNSTVTGVNINWGDNTSANFATVAEALKATHQYATNGTYNVAAVMTFSANGQSFTSGGAGCAKQVTFTSGGGTVTTTSTTPRPTALVNTGPGSTMAMFAAVTALGAVAHRYFLGRRLSNQ